MMKTKILWILLFSLLVVPNVNAIWVTQKSHYTKDNFICEVYLIDYSYDFRSVNINYLNDKTQIPRFYYSNQDINTITCTNTTGQVVSYNLENITVNLFHNHYEWSEPMQLDWYSFISGPVTAPIKIFEYLYQNYVESNITPEVIKNNYIYNGNSRTEILSFEPKWFSHADSGQINICYYFDKEIPEDIYWNHNSPNDCWQAFPTNNHFIFRNYEANSELCNDDAALALQNKSIQQIQKYNNIVIYVSGFSELIYELWLILYWIIRISILVGVIFGVIYLIFWAYNYIKKVIE